MVQIKICNREFPGGPEVSIWGFHCCGLGPIPGWGTKILQAAWHGQKTPFKKVAVEHFLLSSDKPSCNRDGVVIIFTVPV